MKKGLYLVAVFFASVLFLTGCGGSGNKLVCTMSTTQQTYGYDLTIDQEIAFGFESDDKVTDANVEVNVKLSDGLYDLLKDQGDVDESMKALTSTLETNFKAEFGDATKSSKSSYSGKNVTVNIELDASQIQAGTTKEDISKTFKDLGFTCK